MSTPGHNSADARLRSVITVNRWIAGTRFPEREMVLRIEEATHGCVKPADWYVPRKPAPQRGAAA